MFIENNKRVLSYLELINIASTELMPMDCVHFPRSFYSLMSLTCKTQTQITVNQLPWTKFVCLQKNEFIGT